MQPANSPRIDWTLFLIRAVPALLLLVFHGWGKLSGAVGYLLQGQEWNFVGGVAKMGFPFPAVFAVCAALAESVAAFTLGLGFLTRFSAAIVSFNMLVAMYYHISTRTAFDSAAMYLLCAAVFLFVPPGRFSVDHVLRARK